MDATELSFYLKLFGYSWNDELEEFTELDLLGKLFDTKKPQIFAESEVVGDGSDLTGLPSGSEFKFGTAGITTVKNLGIQTTTVDNYETVGAANSFRGIYIGDGSLIFNARLDNPNGYYIGTGRNALNAGPITLGSTMTLDGAWVIV